jgi:hypothetical protein
MAALCLNFSALIVGGTENWLERFGWPRSETKIQGLLPLIGAAINHDPNEENVHAAFKWNKPFFGGDRRCTAEGIPIGFLSLGKEYWGDKSYRFPLNIQPLRLYRILYAEDASMGVRISIFPVNEFTKFMWLRNVDYSASRDINWNISDLPFAGTDKDCAPDRTNYRGGVAIIANGKGNGQPFFSSKPSSPVVEWSSHEQPWPSQRGQSCVGSAPRYPERLLHIARLPLRIGFGVPESAPSNPPQTDGRNEEQKRENGKKVIRAAGIAEKFSDPFPWFIARAISLFAALYFCWRSLRALGEQEPVEAVNWGIVALLFSLIAGGNRTVENLLYLIFRLLN